MIDQQRRGANIASPRAATPCDPRRHTQAAALFKDDPDESRFHPPISSGDAAECAALFHPAHSPGASISRRSAARLDHDVAGGAK
jgi:hypothetical protein